MNRSSSVAILLSLVIPGALFVQGCNKSDTTEPETPQPTISAPTNLRAFSAGATSVGLLWSLSASESDASFLNYLITVRDAGGSTVQSQSVSKGNPQAVITNLTEGTVYSFVIRSTGTGGIVSADSASVKWSPARRLTTDSTNGPPIQVYEFASTAGASGLQFYSIGAGAARTISLAPNPDRPLIDIFLQTNGDGSISLNNIATSGIANSRNTFFSTLTADASDLDDAQTAPPATSTYTLNSYTIPAATATQAKIIYARSVTDDKYVRILIQRNPATGYLYYSTSPNRYVRVQLSYQSIAGNIYAKRPL